MAEIVNFVATRFGSIDFSKPLAYIDLLLALFLVVGFLVYLRRFPVFRVFLGVLFLLGCAALAFLSGFYITAIILGIASNLILISLPLIFAPEIRHYLEKIGRFSFLRLPKITERQKQDGFIISLVNAVYRLAEARLGALIVIRRRTGLGQTVETGTIIDGRLSFELLQSIFSTKSPLHDGAVVIKNQRILAAGCLLPISSEIKLSPPFGTRHRAGLALTRDTDAVVIIVSEQRGEISLAENGKLSVGLDREKLSEELTKFLNF